MDMRQLVRSCRQFLTRTTTTTTTTTLASTAAPRSSSSLLPLAFSRGHKTVSRTKRALKIAPHDSFLPTRLPVPFPPNGGGGGDSIIYNPPASEASPLHTPLLFLPRKDPRRRRLGGALGPDALSDAALPPQMKYKHRTARYHLKEEDMEEMRRLRAEDPAEWTVNRLARKFECSEVFVKMVAPAPAGHKAWLQETLDRKKARWGPSKTRARDDRRRRAEMVYRGEL
ncbi:hypothetical protein AAL_00730 [Moelleriella libera RCEF 2490]|uniref:60S ribosomal protein L20 n=1 Tax=Moelleriella libera RCEF 2490 TaxID=1081109 RepID=A0A166RQA5_9HYPO|nr:hypothetical protein AAL_00730 [Moelleriella libera RCEF 2490]